MDAKPAKQALAITKAFATKGNYVAVCISNRIVAQQLSLNKNEEIIAFTIGNKNNNYNVLVTDLQAGKWLLTTATSKQTITVNEATGTAYFTSKGGSFKLEKLK
jgi:hypothetical protein